VGGWGDGVGASQSPECAPDVDCVLIVGCTMNMNVLSPTQHVLHFTQFALKEAACECPAILGVNVRREFWRGSQACPVNLETKRSVAARYFRFMIDAEWLHSPVSQSFFLGLDGPRRAV
jgi:hypothetical protein